VIPPGVTPTPKWRSPQSCSATFPAASAGLWLSPLKGALKRKRHREPT